MRDRQWGLAPIPQSSCQPTSNRAWQKRHRAFAARRQRRLRDACLANASDCWRQLPTASLNQPNLRSGSLPTVSRRTRTIVLRSRSRDPASARGFAAWPPSGRPRRIGTRQHAPPARVMLLGRGQPRRSLQTPSDPERATRQTGDPALEQTRAPSHTGGHGLTRISLQFLGHSRPSCWGL